MATLEDKILGEKLHYYCSSSESEDEADNEDDDEEGTPLPPQPVLEEPEIRDWEGTSTNTGPKGVISDYRRFRQLEAEKKKEQDIERAQLIKKLSLTCKSASDEQKEKEAQLQLEQELEELLSDDFLNQFIQKRMEEAMAAQSNRPRFGKLIDLVHGQEFLDCIDNEDKNVTVVVHLYEEKVAGCRAMTGCLKCLSLEYPQVKFCQIRATTAGVSKHFKASGVPALLIYKGGQMMGNFIRLTNELGDDFFAADVESFLTEHGMLPDKTCMPSVIRQSVQSEDSDTN